MNKIKICLHSVILLSKEHLFTVWLGTSTVQSIYNRYYIFIYYVNLKKDGGEREVERETRRKTSGGREKKRGKKAWGKKGSEEGRKERKGGGREGGKGEVSEKLLVSFIFGFFLSVFPCKPPAPPAAHRGSSLAQWAATRGSLEETQPSSPLFCPWLSSEGACALDSSLQRHQHVLEIHTQPVTCQLNA